MTIKDKDLERWQKSILNALNNLTNVKARMDESGMFSLDTAVENVPIIAAYGTVSVAVKNLEIAATLLNQRIEDSNENI